VARTNRLIVRAAQAARGRGITFTKAAKSLLSLRDPDDKSSGLSSRLDVQLRLL